jgi:hypothetical protein
MRRSLAAADVLALVGSYPVVLIVLPPSVAMADPIPLLTTLPACALIAVPPGIPAGYAPRGSSRRARGRGR